MPPRPRPQYAGFEPYKAGKPIEEVARELGLTRIVKLASNENPYPPAPAVQDALVQATAEGHRYPDDLAYELVAAIARFHGVPDEAVIVGAGSTDVITYAWRVVAGPGDAGAYPWPSFVMYPMAGTYAGATNVPVPLTATLGHDLDGLLAAARRPNTKVVALCNPNNPTGRHIAAADVDAFLDAVPEDVLVVHDEAYAEYADAPDYPRLLPSVIDRPNVLVTRTFSKVYGLAGLRVGYGIAHPQLAADLVKGRNPFTVSRLAQLAAVVALGEQAEVERRAKENSAERDRLLAELTRRGLAPSPTQGNFVWVPAPDERNWFDLLLHEGVIVRPMPGGLRITFGSPEEDDVLLQILDRILT